MIEVRDLNYSYGSEEALRNVSLQIEDNSTVAIIGPSGCGKTTLLYNLAGLLKPTSGTITIDGVELHGIRSNTGVILQHYGLMPWKTVFDNVALGLIVRKESKELTGTRVNQVLLDLNIEHFKHKYPSELSGGEKQRVGIARALAIRPDLLLMDEPSSALDAITKEHMQNVVLSVYQRNPLTMVMITHNIEEAVFLGQRIVVMGKGTVKHVLENPYFGDVALREKIDFYSVCLEVRRWMGAQNEEG